MYKYKWMKKTLAVFLALALAVGNGSAPILVQGAEQEPMQRQPDYILGRPMTDEEKREQEAMEPVLSAQPVPDDIAESVLGRELRAGGSFQGEERFDLRDLGLVTSVKDQVISGTCWAFAEIAMAESSMLRAGAAGDPDLSEEHLSYFFYNRADDPLGNTPADKNVINWSGYDYKNIGGNPQLASKFLSTWSGAAGEETAPYSSAAGALDPSLAYVSDTHLQEAFFVDASVAEIKEALYTMQRPVGVNYFHSGSHYNADTAAYCYPTKRTDINHAVTIVGWDDTYRKENFLPASQVSSDGAWIVKNSWGGAHGDGGYIYISYEDQTISGAVSAGFEPADNYDHNYQYDGSSGSNAISVPVGASHANVFHVKGNPSGSEILEAVGILMKSAGTDLAIDVYTDLCDPDDPTSGTHAVAGQLVSTRYSGYHTFPLQQAAALREGSFYSVIFTNVSDTAKSFFIESAAESSWIRFDVAAEEGQSFYRAGEGKSWQDMAGHYLSGGKRVNARIKAYTTDSTEILPLPERPTTPTATPDTPTTAPTIPPETPTTAPATPTAAPETPAIPTEMPITPTAAPITPTGAPTTPTAAPTTPTEAPTTPTEKPAAPTKIPVPGRVSLGKISLTAKGVQIKWAKASGASRYEIYRRKLSGESWQRRATVSGTVTSYVDKNTLPATAYSYRVRALSGSGASARIGAYSSIKKILTRPDVPGKISVKRSGRASKSGKARLSMKASARATAYYIYQYDRRAKKYKTAYKISGNKLYIYQKSAKKYKKIGKAAKKGGRITCTLTQIDLKTYNKQYFKIRAYTRASGVGERYSGYSGKITLKR